LIYFWAFVVGGTICVIGQLLLMYTKLTPAHILVILVSSGAILNGLGLYEPLLKFAGGGALIPVSGFGSSVVSGIVQEVRRLGWEGVFTGIFELTGLGIAAAIIFGFTFSLVAAPKR
jgi:stage V sporulation protein AE